MLRRAGHTEAAVDLARMAGLTPAGVLCEILDEQGDRANRDELHELARRFDLPIISIEQLIAYRRVREKLVYRQAEARLPTKYGTGTDHLLRREVRTAGAAGVRARRSDEASPRRWCGCTRRASRATCSSRCAATAATSCTWRST